MSALPRWVRPYHLPGDGDPDPLGEICSDLIACGPLVAAWLRDDRHAEPNFLGGDGEWAPIRALLEAVPRECALAGENFLELRERLREHLRKPGAQRGDAWRMLPELPAALRSLRAIWDAEFRQILLKFDRAIEAAEDENAALSALDGGYAVFDADGDLVAAPSPPR